MSRKGLYRTDVAFIDTYTGFSDGETVTFTTIPIWVKGNLQPWKQGITNTLGSAGVIFSDWRVLYIKDYPVIETTGIPSDATKNKSYFFYEGQWYGITANQDWTIQAKGVKHYKLLAEKVNAPEGVTTPTPFNSLVEDFERAIAELDQTTTLINEVLE